jgi:hypothetical protein
MRTRALAGTAACSAIAVAVVAASCGYGDTTEAEPPSALEACELSCVRLESLRCPAPLPESAVASCRSECAALSEEPRFQDCESLVQRYYACLSKQGNLSCSAPSFEYEDDCSVRRDAQRACLDGRPPSSGLCPASHPVDCGTGFCCPASHPTCFAGGLCGLPDGQGGASGSGG